MGRTGSPQRHGGTERNKRPIERPTPVFPVNADSKKLRFPVNHLESTLTGALVNVAHKGFDAGRLRLKTGKTGV